MKKRKEQKVNASQLQVLSFLLGFAQKNRCNGVVLCCFVQTAQQQFAALAEVTPSQHQQLHPKYQALADLLVQVFRLCHLTVVPYLAAAAALCYFQRCADH